MTKKLRRTEKVEVSLAVNDDKFINTPDHGQRNAILNNILRETVENLHAYDKLAQSFVAAVPQINLTDRTQAQLSDQEIMEDWQIPLMQAMVDVVAGSGANILELGFGRGISSSMIQEKNVASHTIIECNDYIVKKFEEWKTEQNNNNIYLVHGLWQDALPDLGTYDGIFFHTYPLNSDEYMSYVNGKTTFAAHFFQHAAEHLVAGGSFTYLTNEIDSLSREHQRLILSFFSSFSIQTVDLDMSKDVKDTWWANKMVVIRAVK